MSKNVTTLKFPDLITDIRIDEDALNIGEYARYELTALARRLMQAKSPAFMVWREVFECIQKNPEEHGLKAALPAEFGDPAELLSELIQCRLLMRVVVPGLGFQSTAKVRPDMGLPLTARSLVVATVNEQKQPASLEDATKVLAPELSLTAEALRLVDSLPAKLSLANTMEQYPRVLNRLADLWRRPLELEREFKILLMDDRGNRRGFPFEVILELSALRDFHARFVQHRSASGWDNSSAYWR